LEGEKMVENLIIGILMVISVFILALLNEVVKEWMEK
jgi:hypothetical protein